MKTPSLLALLSLAAVACSGAPPVPAGGRTPDCPLELLYKPPARPYEPLGHKLEHVMAVPPGGAPEVLRPWACALGADAVIVERNQVLNLMDHVLVEGTAIRYTLAPTPPPEAPPAATPAPAPDAAPPPPAPPPEPKPSP
jgi:hypothetical protein